MVSSSSCGDNVPCDCWGAGVCGCLVRDGVLVLVAACFES